MRPATHVRLRLGCVSSSRCRAARTHLSAPHMRTQAHTLHYHRAVVARAHDRRRPCA